MLTDPIADSLTRVRNGYSAKKSTVKIYHSKYLENIFGVLQAEGYIRGFRPLEVRKGIQEIEVELKYHEGLPVLKEISRVSKPGRRVYADCKALPKVYGGLGTYIVSTNQGVMSDAQARDKNLGGEIICRVY